MRTNIIYTNMQNTLEKYAYVNICWFMYLSDIKALKLVFSRSSGTFFSETRVILIDLSKKCSDGEFKGSIWIFFSDIIFTFTDSSNDIDGETENKRLVESLNPLEILSIFKYFAPSFRLTRCPFLENLETFCYISTH
jgi:hypothetical protein